jgi:hypothetical protein
MTITSLPQYHLFDSLAEVGIDTTVAVAGNILAVETLDNSTHSPKDFVPPLVKVVLDLLQT